MADTKISALSEDTSPDPAADFVATADTSATASKKVKPINLAAIHRIGSTVLGADTASITFSSIPATFRHLLLIVAARSSTVATNTAMQIRFNADTGSNYNWQLVLGNVSAAAGSESLGVSAIVPTLMTAASSTANRVGVATLWIYDYLGAWHKHTTSTGLWPNSDASGNHQVYAGGGTWRNTAAITSITVLAAAGDLKQNSRAELYGIN